MSGMRIENSSTASKWGSKLDSKKTAVKESQPKIPAVPEGDGFTTVSHAKPRTIDKPSNRNNGARRSPPSAAAQSRRGVYEPATKATSHYKQSCLPIDERDPKLVEIEANKGMTYRKSDFRPGMIVRGYLHEQDYIATSTGSNLTIKDHNRTDSRYGPICTKARKMIILVMFEDHYLAVPLFTHNGNGLAYKTKPMEFVSIRDHRVVGNHPPPQSDNPPLETEFINRGIEQFDPKSAAHITYVLPRRYELPVVMEGRLTLASLNGLIDLFNYYAPRCLKDASRRKL
ncbi:MAG: hypothetical protein LQ346_006970 [Caloplaca aetnensis]|nr:MAG: hypothetical protein LQ346_006970 [Caloplaca aetnensis]